MAVEEMQELDPALSGEWVPTVGPEANGLIAHLDLGEEASDRALRENLAILARCVSPTGPAKVTTGLVIGYVQSGKTLSFTMVAALAKDNGYRLVIVLSGTTVVLSDQSTRRLEKDLQRKNPRKRWLILPNPSVANVDTIRTQIESNRRTVLITVMKNGSYLDRLTKILRALPLSDVATLIIDDEADQASLNTKVRLGNESATYARVKALRDAVPRHTYLQYTATPQAPLLISIADQLSPEFVCLLTPGNAYTGGKAFFEEGMDLVRVIDDLDQDDEVPLCPPDTLLEALRTYFLGVAIGLSQDSDDEENRSMMVHPSMKTATHKDYLGWVKEIRRRWKETLLAGETHPVNLESLEVLKEFEQSYRELQITSGEENIPTFDEVKPFLLEAMQDVVILEVNASKGKTPIIKWTDHYGYILVGGEVLNRGFTIEGLTTSYMPRALGTGQADTLEQRARWFGYKEDYLGICRVWLTEQTKRAYEQYVLHEETLRASLRRFVAQGQSLSEWKRAFFLSPELKPTRSSVLLNGMLKTGLAGNWFAPKFPGGIEAASALNRLLLRELASQLSDDFTEDEGRPERTQEQRHLVATTVSLKWIYDSLVSSWRQTDANDSAGLTGVALQIGAWLEQHPDEQCRVYLMRKGDARSRGLNEDGSVKNLFQGENPNHSTGKDVIYPGDQQLHSRDQVTFQFSRFNLHLDHEDVENDVPVMAVRVPKKMASPWMVQRDDFVV